VTQLAAAGSLKAVASGTAAGGGVRSASPEDLLKLRGAFAGGTHEVLDEGVEGVVGEEVFEDWAPLARLRSKPFGARPRLLESRTRLIRATPALHRSAATIRCSRAPTIYPATPATRRA
jgi:hypothetical protein